MKFYIFTLLLSFFNFSRVLYADNLDYCSIPHKSNDQQITRGGILQNTPFTIFYPANVEEIQELIHLGLEHSKKIRCVGSTHSLNPCATNDGYTISLDRMDKIVEIAEDYCIVEAGIKIRNLCMELEKHGLTLPILGAIAEQTVAGAAMTGTRGQGPSEGSFGSIIEALEIVDGNGNIHHFSKQTCPEKLHASITSLGLLGVVTKVKIRCKPLFLMAEIIQRLKFEETLNRLDEFLKNEKFVMYWNVFHDEIKVITGHIIDCHFPPKSIANFTMEGNYPHIHSLENFPPTLQRMGKSWQIHTLLEWPEEKAERLNEKILNSNECIYQPEYSIDKSDLIPCLEDIKNFFRENSHRLKLARNKMVLEIRPVKRDPVWLSPSYDKDVYSICFHDFQRSLEWDDEFAENLRDLENVLRKYNIRPHLGKAHFFTSKHLQDAFPKWLEFLELRKEMDPNNVFLSSYCRYLIK